MKKLGSLYSKTDILKAVGEYCIDALPQVGYPEDHFWTNVRILLSMVCCAFGCWGQFGTKFPKDWVILAGCVAGYFVFAGVITVLDYIVVKQAVMCTKLSNGEIVFIDANLPMFSTEFTLTARGSSKKIDHKVDVTHYFDSDGVLRQEHLFNDLTQLLKKFESKDNAKKTS